MEGNYYMNNQNLHYKKKVILRFILIFILLFLLSILFLFFKWGINISNIGNRDIEMNYYKSIEVNTTNDIPYWEIIKSKEKLMISCDTWGTNLEELRNINFDKNSIILSMGRKINKIVYRRNDKLPSLFYEDSGIACVGNEFYPNTFFVYLIDSKEKVYVDMHYSSACEYIIE